MNILLSWLDAHNGTISAAATIVLVFITAWYAWQARETVCEMRRQRAADEENRFLAQRPVVYPVDKLSSDGSTIGLDWLANRCHITLANAGPGLATDLCAVLMAPPDRSGALPRRYTLWKDRPLPPGEGARQLVMEVGQTMVGTTARIGAYALTPPPAPAHMDLVLGRAPIVEARLTLTYRDVFGRKHAAIFDYTSLQRWENAVFLAGIPSDLADLDLEARPRPDMVLRDESDPLAVLAEAPSELYGDVS